MIAVLTLILASSFLNLWGLILAGTILPNMLQDASKPSETIMKFVMALFCLANISFELAMWLFCFKYWQTAQELDYLFFR